RGVPMTVRAGLATVPERSLRSLLLTLSHRRWLGRLATRTSLSRPIVRRFVAGERLDEALGTLERLSASGMRTTVDVLGESVSSPELANRAADRYLETLGALARRGLDRNVSLKLSQMGLAISTDVCVANIERIVARAAELDAFVRIDMEDHTTVDATLDVWRAARALHPHVGIVLQAALRRSAADLDRLIAERAPIRLCKGAYKEPAAVAFPDKAEVDRNYAQLMERLIREGESPAIATHDERLVARAIEVATREGIPADRFEFQMLFGIRRDLQGRLVGDGYRVRVYVPYGSEWYPYFMRRLAERPANVAFILRSLLSEARRGST
ncbi:MAG TPA: proline dehydrogenase family protein, partial [Candidatus Limnocylindrales bacterium]